MELKNKKNPNFTEETRLWRRGFKRVVGLDEAGRGPLAGPVVAAAVCASAQTAAKLETKNKKIKITNKNLKLFGGLKDSKKLLFRQREQWYDFLTAHPDIKWGVGIVPEKTIDKINIFEATKLAMKRALADMEITPEFLLLDGSFLLDGLDISQKAIIRADEKIFSCAAASIIAKVTRDRLMQKYHKKYPAYGFDRHKGYGTRAHFAAIKKHGACRLHRLSFAPFRHSGGLS